MLILFAFRQLEQLALEAFQQGDPPLQYSQAKLGPALAG
jgi:hypothetical protein